VVGWEINKGGGGGYLLAYLYYIYSKSHRLQRTQTPQSHPPPTITIPNHASHLFRSLRHHHSPTLPAPHHAPPIPARIALAWRRHPDCILCAAGAGCSQKGCLLAKTSLRRFAACAGVGTAHTASMEPQVMLKAVRDKVAKVVKHIG